MKPFLFLLFCFVTGTNFSQESSNHFIFKKQAIKTAKRHGLYPIIKLKNRLGWIETEWIGWDSATARLDTAAKIWEIEVQKLTYRSWGKTTKLGKKDRCQRCRFINDCHVLRTRKVWINAITGKVLKKEKKKKVSGNYE